MRDGSELDDTAPDDEALEAATVIERQKLARGAASLRLSPLQPAGPDPTISLSPLGAPGRPTLSLPAAPADREPPPLLPAGTEPVRSLGDPWPAGSARRNDSRSHSAARPSLLRPRRRTVVLASLVSFAGGLGARELAGVVRSLTPSAPAALSAARCNGNCPGGSPSPAPLEPRALPTSPDSLPPTGKPEQKRRRTRRL